MMMQTAYILLSETRILSAVEIRFVTFFNQYLDIFPWAVEI